MSSSSAMPSLYMASLYMPSFYTIPSSKTVTGITMTMVNMTMMSISWRSCLLLKVKWDSRLHVTYVGSSKLEMKLFSFRKELARAKECLWHRSILWVIFDIGLSRVQHRVSRWHGWNYSLVYGGSVWYI